MKDYKLIIPIIIGMITFSSCEKINFLESEENTPENNYQLLWEEMDNRYALFEVRKVDWDSLYVAYRPKVNASTSENELWEVMTEMLEHLKDGHVKLEDNKDRYFEAGNEVIKEAEKEFDRELVRTKYQEYDVTTSDNGLSYGQIKNKNIGYMHFFDMEGPDAAIIDEIMSELKKHDALIMDLRNNSGGDDAYAHRIAGAFADGEHLIYTVQTRNGKNHSDFDQKREWYSKSQGAGQYLKPIMLLTNRYTVSAAEILTLNMKSFTHVTHIGDTTNGMHSDQSPLRFLPNGWSFAYSHQLYLMPDGNSLEGIGIAPNIFFKNSEGDIQSGNDLVLEKSIQYLLDRYGIN